MELIKLLSLFVALGALTWLVYEVIASDDVLGLGRDTSGAMRKAGLVFLIAVVVNIVAGRLQRKK